MYACQRPPFVQASTATSASLASRVTTRTNLEHWTLATSAGLSSPGVHDGQRGVVETTKRSRKMNPNFLSVAESPDLRYWIFFVIYDACLARCFRV